MQLAPRLLLSPGQACACVTSHVRPWPPAGKPVRAATSVSRSPGRARASQTARTPPSLVAPTPPRPTPHPACARPPRPPLPARPRPRPAPRRARHTRPASRSAQRVERKQHDGLPAASADLTARSAGHLHGTQLCSLLTAAARHAASYASTGCRYGGTHATTTHGLHVLPRRVRPRACRLRWATSSPRGAHQRSRRAAGRAAAAHVQALEHRGDAVARGERNVCEVGQACQCVVQGLV